MHYRVLGRTGISVSALCLGVMSFGAGADRDTSAAIFQRCREVGINFFDCANTYADGQAEEILGKLIRSCRDEVIITSKFSSPIGTGANDRGASRRHLTLAVEASLKRLQTDRLEFYFVHHFDYKTPIDETLRALDDLIHQGKILHPAVSNWSAWQTMKALGIAEREHLACIACLQPMYNLVKRQAESEILPMAASEQLGVISYSPLGGGLLTGKYSMTQKPEQGRLIENQMYAKRYGNTLYYQIAERFADYAANQGIHPATLAVAWVMANPTITAPIIGARSLEQLEPSLAALKLELSPEQYQEITSLSYDPAPANDRSEEQHP